MRTLIQKILALLLVIAASTAEGQQINAITNGAFQSGSSGWTTFGSFYADSRFSNCHSCPGYAYLSNNDGTGGNNLVGWITQQVSIPAGATGASLTFWYSITTTDTSGVPHDVVSVTLIDSTTNASTLVHAFDNRNAGSGYSSYSYDLSNFVGKTFTVQFLGSTDGSSPTVFRIDDVGATYTPAPPPPPPQPPSPPTNLVATGSGNSINLTWNDNASNELAYEVQRASLGGAFGLLTTLGPNRTTYTDSIGSYGVIDCYQVRATNTAGVSGYTNQACGTTLAPPNLSYPADGASLTNASVAMSWQSALGATNYIVNVGRSCGGTEIVNGQSTIEVSLSIPVSQGTYVWQVQTRNTNYPGASEFSQCRSFTISTNPAPIANFTWSPQPAKDGQPVSFTDQSSSATSWLWTFGDGSTSTLQNPAHTFGGAGSYTVALTATNSIGSNSTTRTVTVVAPPIASFTSSPASPTTGQAITFTDTSTDAPTSWQWTFGDTATSILQNPSHTYGSAGTYTVTLTASNAAGGNTTSRQIQVGTTPTVPVASFTYSPANPQTGQTVSFTDTSSGSPTAWQWSFGDGASSTNQNPSHVYANANTYHVVMSAANVAGSNSTAQDLKVVATPHVPTASFIYSPQSPAAGQAVTYTDTSGFAPTSWGWNFGDGGTSAAQNPTHTFASAGTFTVSLTATNSAGTNATNQQITVRSTGSAPTASFTYSPNPPQAGQIVTFADTSGGNPTSWTWTFSDGGTASTATTTHTFAFATTFAVSLKVANTFGSNSTSQQVTVTGLPASIPRSPTNTTAFADGTNINVRWDDNSSNESGFRIDRAVGQSGSPAQLDTTPKDVTFYTDSSLLVGIPSCYQVSAFNIAGSSTPSAPACATPLSPPSPLGPSDGATLNDSTITLRWATVTNAAEYEVQVGTSCQHFDVDSATVRDLSYSLSLPRDGAFAWRVRAKSALLSSQSAYSRCGTFTLSSGCSTCATIKGHVVFKGGGPIRAGAGRTVHLTGSGVSVDKPIDATGGFSFDVSRGPYRLSADIPYRATIPRIDGHAVASTESFNVVADATHDIELDSPIVLLHGILSSPDRWTDWASDLALRYPSALLIGPTYNDATEYAVAAATVKQQLDSVLLDVTTDLPPLRVIAHSKGGLITRALTGIYPAYETAISDLVELATPNQGVFCYTTRWPSAIASNFHLTPQQVLAEVVGPYKRFGERMAIHVIVGTANRADVPVVDTVTPVCADSCETNDGYVNANSAATITAERGGVTKTVRLDGLAVPYSHMELGTKATLWLLDVIIEPYYDGHGFDSCGVGAFASYCGSTWCASGRGATFLHDCTVIPQRSGMPSHIHWTPPVPYIDKNGDPQSFGPPLFVTVKKDPLSSSCDSIFPYIAVNGITGYRIYRRRSGTFIGPVNTPGAELVGFVGPGNTNFYDWSAADDSDFTVCAVYEGNLNVCASPAALPPTRRRPS